MAPNIIIAVVVIALSGVLAHANWPEKRLPGGMAADRIVVDKSDRRMELYSGGVVIASYDVSLGREPGAKRVEGDKRTPEGIYKIDRHKEDSAYHRALHISYPSADDRAAAGDANPGGDIMIHGIRNGFGWIGKLHRMADWTLGCIAVTNPEMDEIYGAVKDGTIIEIKP